MAKLHPTPLRLVPENVNRYAPDGWKLEAEALGKLRLEGKIIRFHVADGHAVYHVVSKNPLVLQHVLWADDYTVHPALIRGLELTDVEDLIQKELAWARFASRKSTVEVS